MRAFLDNCPICIARRKSSSRGDSVGVGGHESSFVEEALVLGDDNDEDESVNFASMNHNDMDLFGEVAQASKACSTKGSGL